MTSIKDVATLANVSISTVSRVLSGHGGVRQDKVERINHAVKQLNYEPNVFGRGLRNSRTDTILLVFSRLIPACLQGVLDAAGRSNYNVLLQSSTHLLDDYGLIKPVIRKQVDGVIFQDVLISSDVYSKVSERVPLVQIGDHANHPGADIITIDNEEMAYQMTCHLIEQGHKRIAYVYILNRQERYYNLVHLRERGIRRALSENGISDDKICLGLEPIDNESQFSKPWTGDNDSHPAIQYGRQVADKLAKAEGMPDALFCYNDLLAYGCFRHFTKMGLRIPDDIAISGFDGQYPISECTPVLTSVTQPFYQMGTEGVGAILSSIRNDRQGPNRKVMLDGILKFKQSTQAR